MHKHIQVCITLYLSFTLCIIVHVILHTTLLHIKFSILEVHHPPGMHHYPQLCQQYVA